MVKSSSLSLMQKVLVLAFVMATRCNAFTSVNPIITATVRCSTVTATWRTATRERSQQQTTTIIEPDYLITDSIEKLDRPTFYDFLSTPRNALGMSLMVVGTAVALFNVLGIYDDSYLQLEIVSVILGFANAAADFRASPPNQISPNIRTGAVDDALVHWYAATYTASATWLALRTSFACPSLLTTFDPLLATMALGIFIFSLACPVLTLMHHFSIRLPVGTMRSLVGIARFPQEIPDPTPILTPTELLRAQSLLVVGIVGCVFAPETLTMSLRGQEWWHRVGDLHPNQPWMESSTALFALFATQASMIAHRAGKAGVAPFQVICPIFAGVCIVLTIAPCVSALHWLGSGISFWGFYTE